MKKNINICIILIIALFIILTFHYTIRPSKEKSKENRYIRSIKLAGEWFLSNQNESFLYYQYLPFEKVHLNKHHSLREMGALWAIAKLSNYLGDSRYESLAQKGFRHFEKFFEYDEENDFYYVNITPKKIKLGYSAFIILTLLEIDHPKKEYYLDKFAKGIIFMQNRNGSLRTFFYSDRSTGIDYYPGEALFALMSLYEYKKEPRYLKIAQRAFRYYVRYWRKNRNTAFVPWQTRAYHKLYSATAKKEVADFVFEMNDYMLNQHNARQDCINFDFSRGIVTAVYIEGLNLAYGLAKELNDKKRVGCYANFIKEGSDFILSLQVINRGKFAKEAIGGFLQKPNSKTMRVDRNQHAAIALMKAYELGILKD